MKQCVVDVVASVFIDGSRCHCIKEKYLAFRDIKRTDVQTKIILVVLTIQDSRGSPHRLEYVSKTLKLRRIIQARPT